MNKLRHVTDAGGKRAAFILLGALICAIFLFSSPLFSQEQEAPAPSADANAHAGTLKLDQAAMCEDITDQTPLNPAVVFSIKRQIVYCFSSFDLVPQKTFVHHNWYLNDKLSTKIKLRLQPPRWSTYSRIQLREADIGPWRVEITDEEDNLLKILRFSVTE